MDPRPVTPNSPGRGSVQMDPRPVTPNSPGRGSVQMDPRPVTPNSPGRGSVQMHPTPNWGSVLNATPPKFLLGGLHSDAHNPNFSRPRFSSGALPPWHLWRQVLFWFTPTQCLLDEALFFSREGFCSIAFPPQSPLRQTLFWFTHTQVYIGRCSVQMHPTPIWGCVLMQPHPSFSWKRPCFDASPPQFIQGEALFRCTATPNVSRERVCLHTTPHQIICWLCSDALPP